jgi:nitrate/nitrite transporter NarK
MGGLTPFLMTVLLLGISRTVLQPDGQTVQDVVVPPLIHWRSSFWLFGGLGMAWCVLFALWFRNRPAEKDTVNESERKLILAGRSGEEGGHHGVPWLKLLTSGNLWVLCLMYFCAAYGWYFNITYLPTFLEQQHGVDRSSLIGALYKGGPLWLGAIACLGGGFLTDAFIHRTGNRKWGRRLFGVIGHGLCATCYLASMFTDSAFTFFLAISFAAFCNDLTMGAAWATCQDIGKRYAAIVAGAMNTIGNLGGAIAGTVTAAILNASLTAHAAGLGRPVDQLSAAEKAAGLLPGYHINFLTFAGVYFLAVVFWLFVDATRPVAEPADADGTTHD